MPSKEYLEMLKKEAGDPLPPVESSKKDKAKDFWYYHRFIFLIVCIAIAVIGFLIYDAVTTVDPDINIAILTDQPYVPNETLEALEADFAAFVPDYNGDGQVSVYISLYNPAFGADAETADPNMQMAAITKLMGDMTTMETTIYLTDVFDEAQPMYEMFAVQGDVSTLATDVTQAGPALADTNIIPLGGEFEELGSKEVYDYFYENLYLTTRVFDLENLNEEKTTLFNNSMEVYDAIAGE